MRLVEISMQNHLSAVVALQVLWTQMKSNWKTFDILLTGERSGPAVPLLSWGPLSGVFP